MGVPGGVALTTADTVPSPPAATTARIVPELDGPTALPSVSRSVDRLDGQSAAPQPLPELIQLARTGLSSGVRIDQDQYAAGITRHITNRANHRGSSSGGFRADSDPSTPHAVSVTVSGSNGCGVLLYRDTHGRHRHSGGSADCNEVIAAM